MTETEVSAPEQPSPGEQVGSAEQGSAEQESPSEHLAALVRDGRIRVMPGHRLPRLGAAAGWPHLAELQLLCGDSAATLMAPTWKLGSAPDRFLHLVWSPETDGELCEVGALDERADVLAALQTGLLEWYEPAARPPLRPDWYAPGWQTDAASWVDEQLTTHGRHRTGPAELIRMWSLSAVLRLPTDRGPVYFKATCSHFAGEPGITAVLSQHAADLVPELVAIDPVRSWMLMHPLPGVHPPPRRPEDAPATAAALARLQVELAPAGDQLLAAGAADRRLEPTLAALDQVLTHTVEADLMTAEARAVAAQLGPWLTETLTELAASGPPYSICHGDLHTGNIAREDARLVIFDWTDAALSFPSLDVSLLAASAGADHEAEIWDAYAGVWREAGYDLDLPRLVELSRIGRLAYQAISYEQIFRSQEPRVRWEMAHGVTSNLEELGELWPGRR